MASVLGKRIPIDNNLETGKRRPIYNNLETELPVPPSGIAYNKILLLSTDERILKEVRNVLGHDNVYGIGKNGGLVPELRKALRRSTRRIVRIQAATHEEIVHNKLEQMFEQITSEFEINNTATRLLSEANIAYLLVEDTGLCFEYKGYLQSHNIENEMKEALSVVPGAKHGAEALWQIWKENAIPGKNKLRATCAFAYCGVSPYYYLTKATSVFVEAGYIEGTIIDTRPVEHNLDGWADIFVYNNSKTLAEMSDEEKLKLPFRQEPLQRMSQKLFSQ